MEVDLDALNAWKANMKAAISARTAMCRKIGKTKNHKGAAGVGYNLFGLSVMAAKLVNMTQKRVDEIDSAIYDGDALDKRRVLDKYGVQWGMNHSEGELTELLEMLACEVVQTLKDVSV